MSTLSLSTRHAGFFVAGIVTSVLLHVLWKETTRINQQQSAKTRHREADEDAHRGQSEKTESLMKQEAKEDEEEEKKKQDKSAETEDGGHVMLHIDSPDMVELHPYKVREEWELFTAPSHDKTKVTVHLHLLLVNWLNRLIKQKVVTRQAISMVADPGGSTTIQMVLSESLIPTIVSQCETFGVGTNVGMIYSFPIQMIRIPATNQSTNDDDDEGVANLIVAQPEVVQRRSSTTQVASNFESSASSFPSFSQRSYSRMSSMGSSRPPSRSSSGTSSLFGLAAAIVTSEEKERQPVETLVSGFLDGALKSVEQNQPVSTEPRQSKPPRSPIVDSGFQPKDQGKWAVAPPPMRNGAVATL